MLKDIDVMSTVIGLRNTSRRFQEGKDSKVATGNIRERGWKVIF